VQRTPGVDPGTVWCTVVWPRHGNCVAYHVINSWPRHKNCVAYRVVSSISSPSCVLLGPWLFRGGCWLYALCVRDQVVLDATQVHRVSKVYKLCRGTIYLDSHACGLRHARVKSQ